MNIYIEYKQFCLNQISNFNSKITLLNKTLLNYTNIFYAPGNLNINIITYFKNKYKLPVGYGHH